MKKTLKQKLTNLAVGEEVTGVRELISFTKKVVIEILEEIKFLKSWKNLSKNFKTSVTKGVKFSLCKVKGSLTSFTFLGKRYACLWQIGKCRENNPFQILLFDNWIDQGRTLSACGELWLTPWPFCWKQFRFYEYWVSQGYKKVSDK